jgi:hypothetical protein
MIEIETIKIGPWIWSLWPTLPLPTESWLRERGADKGPAWLHEFHAKREESIAREQHNPLIYGWEQPPLLVIRQLLAGTYVPGQFGVSIAPPGWKQEKPANDIAALGGNGSGKTEVQAKLATEVLIQKPGSEARCFSQNETTSVRYIQRAMFKYLPPELRTIKSQGQVTKISYKEATGFSDSVYVMPQHSTALFPTYKGWEQDRTSVEGGECHVLTWDEEMPRECLETIRFRAHKTGGFVLGGFTPVQGYTETVAEYIEGATILEVIPARAVVWDWWNRSWSWGEWLLPKDRVLVKGCPPGHLPLVVQAGAGSGRRFAVVFPTFFNPYTNVATVTESTAGKPDDHKLERLWGWATNRVRNAFPDFSHHHTIKRERLPRPEDLTLYAWMDPHGRRNWFILYVGVDAQERKYCLKEWPTPDMGEWALPAGKVDGKMRYDGKEGPAQRFGGGRNFNFYKKLLVTLEGWAPNDAGVWTRGPNAWTIQDKRMDPRPAGTEVPSDDDEHQTYQDHMNGPILDASGAKLLLPGQNVAAGPHCDIEEGIQRVNDWLTDGWDPNAPVTPLNCPGFFVCEETCPATAWTLRTFTGADGEKGACKDPFDCLKGLAKLGVRYLPAGALGSYGRSFSY